MKSKNIVVTDIRVEERSGTEILVVEDGNKNQFTTPDPYLVNRFRDVSEDQEDRYIGVQWQIAFTTTESGYRDFEGFLSKAVDRDSEDETVESRIEQLENVVARLENQVRELQEGESSD